MTSFALLAAVAGVLKLTRSRRLRELLAGLAEIGLEVVPPDMNGWRVDAPDGDGELDLVCPDMYALSD